MRANFRKRPARLVSRDLNRTASAVFQRASKLGLCIPNRITAPDFEQFLREKHALGWSDSQIAIERKIDRHAVTSFRKRLALPSALHSEHQRRRVREKTAEQLKKSGLQSIGFLRVEAFKKFARDNGWPENLQFREVQVLNLLWDRGPQTRPEIAAGIGMRWKGARKSLMGNRKGGSLLATLIRRGMVVNLGRIAKHPDCGKGNRAGQGKTRCVYSLAPTIQRRKVAS